METLSKFFTGKNGTIYFLCLFSLTSACLFAQSEQFRFKQLDLKDGLSHPDIATIYKDSRGFVWLGTASGLNRFDGYSIKSFVNDPLDTTSLPNYYVYKIFETPERMLACMTSIGLTLYDPESETFDRHPKAFFEKYGTSDRLFKIVQDTDGSYWFVERDKLIKYHPRQDGYIVIENNAADPLSITKEEITDFCIDKNRNYWLIHANGKVERIQIHNKKGVVAERITVPDDAGILRAYRILADSDGDLWLYGAGASNRVFVYDVKKKKLIEKSVALRLNANFVTGMLEDENGLMWIGTDHGGIILLDKRTGAVRYLFHADGDQTSLAANSITYLYKDDQGVVWIGTYKRGVSYYHPNIYQFDIYKHYATDPHSLPFEDINRFEEDKKGNLWIGTNGGGLLYFDRQKGTFRQYLHEPANKNSLSGNVVVSLCLDADDNLWIGTYKDGLNKFDGKNFTRFTHTPGDTTSLPSVDVWEIFEDSQKRIWIGTTDAGAALFDKKMEKFHRIKLWGPNGMQSNTVEAINEDRYGNIWFGTFSGIDVLSVKDQTFSHFEYSSKPNSLSSNVILDIMKDSKGRMWIGTSNGLNLFDESTKGFSAFKENNRRDNAVLTIQEDNIGDIWISALHGLSKITLAAGSLQGASVKHYTELDGLQGRQFNSNASFKTHRGELIFGGPTGFNIFRGNQQGKDFLIDKVIFSDLELYEKRVDIGEKIEGATILNKSISEIGKITLPYNKNFFSLKLSALNYLNPERDQYIYQLEGLNEDWLPVDSKNHEIIFNSLNPGNYLLRVRALNGDGVPSKNDAILVITIQPPFWKSRVAFILYGLIVVVVLFFTRKIIQQREQMKFSIEQERREMQRLHELDMLKVKFFTNVSHEFRTPLTLILTPVERLIKKAKDPEQLAQFQLVLRNGKRLMNLVNQLLDFKKLEVHEIQFSPSQGDVIAFIKDTVFSFSDLAEKKNIKLSFDSVVNGYEISFDHDKLEKILFNLLSNAFKFTLENGSVTVTVDILREANEQLIQIDVSDTGIGIPKDKLDKIFEPFFQSDIPRSIVNQGSGIGLAITKEFVRIHGGHIQVKSEVGVGSSFTVMLPLRESEEASAHKEEVNITDSHDNETMVLHEVDGVVNSEKLPAKTEKKSLLLIDDNDDFRFYLRDNLKFSYTIHEAGNGKDGWGLVLSLQPDLIVSDIAMPEMDGIELCIKIKSDERVSHIPVILLTARSNEDQRIEGLKAGADDYITKPFNFEVLEARINNLLCQREKFQKAFRKTLDIKSSELQITPLDVKFMEKAIKIVEANISSPSFSIQDLGMELGISRAYVFKKILALSGKTPLEFIRTIRLQHAAQLLERSQLSVREVAYKVGFNTPKYFTKYFKEQYGVLPSDYVASKKQEDENPESPK